MLVEPKSQDWALNLFYEGDTILKDIYTKLYKGNKLEIEVSNITPVNWEVKSYAHKGDTDSLRYYHESNFFGFDAYHKVCEYVNFKMVELEMIIDDCSIP